MGGRTEERTDRSVAFAGYYRRHYRAVLGYAVRRLTDVETAREVAVDVFRVAWARFDPGSEPTRAWLLRVARNRIGDAYRERERDRRLLRDLEQQAAPDRERAADERVREVLDRLPAGMREVLALTYWDGLSAAEAGAVLGCSAGAVWVRLHRARRAFAAAWGSEDST